MKEDDIHVVMAGLEEVVKQWPSPAVTIVSQREGNPFKVLVSCILSLRTQDRTTGPASERLFALADTPAAMVRLSKEDIEKAIYPVGFYRTKAEQILDICRLLLERYGGRVPDDLDELLAFKGVGRKTANLVITLGFGKPGICVDTHVHRICNRWGYIRTKTPEQTEFALRRILPHRYWLVINDYLVTFGQNHCTPVSPRCSTCVLVPWCDRVGVVKHR
ncbi:endonuclease III domain-containing protein [Geobacter anodireducens]|uniref:Endonuclease III n=1 Tax=Geobacter anodireducens TaxID=1340425 RepID=A0ABR9NTJ4_9BACT|nr:endonuclease III [Geobacter anodireducens]ANA40527.1 endonuclease III [Geobacter anodireducens]MBE2887580.1 endonuclease III [Geobacter anodireducens]HMN02561.1 endonuclease III [Geobacter anodireducens]